MERMTPKRLHVMLDEHDEVYKHYGKQSYITGLTYTIQLEGNRPNGITSFCVSMVPLVYEGPIWWHVVAGEIPAELTHEPRNFQSISVEIRRVLKILRPKLSVGDLDRLRESGWLYPID